MVPLIFANSGDSLIIKKVGVISENDGDLIVSVKESRVAVSREMAEKIMV